MYTITSTGQIFDLANTLLKKTYNATNIIAEITASTTKYQSTRIPPHRHAKNASQVHYIQLFFKLKHFADFFYFPTAISSNSTSVSSETPASFKVFLIIEYSSSVYSTLSIPLVFTLP